MSYTGPTTIPGFIHVRPPTPDFLHIPTAATGYCIPPAPGTTEYSKKNVFTHFPRYECRSKTKSFGHKIYTPCIQDIHILKK